MREKDYHLHFSLENNFWYFTLKTAIIRDNIKKLTNKYKNTLHILEVGCGSGRNLELINKYGTGFGVDNNLIALNLCQKRKLKNLIVGDANKLPFKNASFDIVCTFDLLEHLEDDYGCLMEFRRTLKKGGYLIISVPAFRILWGEHDLALGHKRRYSKTELIKKISTVGFKLERCTYFNFFIFLPLLIFRKFISSVPKNKINIDILHLDFEYKPFLIISNLFFPYIAKLEIILLRHFNLPWGVSLFSIYKKVE